MTSNMSMTITVIVALIVGASFIILFTFVAYETASASNVINFSDGQEFGKTMPALYYLNDCGFPGSTSDGNLKEIKERTWISMVKIDRKLGYGSGIKAPCTILTSELASEIPSLDRAIKGADGCINGSEVCQVSYGISMGGDESDYELTITQKEAAEILDKVRLGQYNTAMLASGDGFYMMWFHTSEESDGGAQVEASFLEPTPSYEPVSLAAGESISYSLLVKTWATHGGPAKIDLLTDSSAKDSGLLVQFEPSTLEMEERSEARAILKITATKDVKNGIYGIPMSARINDEGYIPVRNCDFTCLEIRVGNSNWHIQTFGSDSRIGLYGPGDTPEGLYLDLQTDKESYSVGQPIVISAFLINEGSERITLDGDLANRRLVSTIYAIIDSNGYSPGSVYGIDAYDFEATEPIMIDPKSKILLVRSFTWDRDNDVGWETNSGAVRRL